MYKNNDDQIAIVGMACVMPKSADLNEFWKNLEGGRDLITEIPKDRWDWNEYYGDPLRESDKTNIKWGGFVDDIDKFDATFFGISNREAILIDPQHRLFLQTVWKAIENSGHKVSDFSGTKTGLFVGVATWDYNILTTRYEVEGSAHGPSGVTHSILPNRVSYLLNLTGPSEAIDTACSSSLVAIHRAVQSMRSGDCDMAIVGGTNALLDPKLYISFNKAGMLSLDGRCKTFDKGANGYVRGEGAGAIILKPLSHAKRDGDYIYAVIKGSAENHGGHTASLTVPNPIAQADLLVTAYERSGLDPTTVSYIEAHGTGTSMGDPIEINGLKKAFKKLYENWEITAPKSTHCGVGSVKTNIGHLEAAAGIAGIIKILLSIKHKKLPASINFTELNPYIELKDSPFYIVTETKDWQPKDPDGKAVPRRAGVSSFGFGGVNAHVILEEYENESSSLPLDGGGKEGVVAVLSAKNEDRLRAYAKEMSEYLSRFTSHQLRVTDIAYTLQVGRDAMSDRLAVVVSNLDELADKLLKFSEGKKEIDNLYTGTVKKGKAKPALLADGQDGKELDKLAKLWVSGVEVDWKLLYSDQLPRRIQLPTYPFAKESYWFPIKKKDKGQALGQERLHPLLDRIDPKSSLDAGIVFEKKFSESDRIVGDHRVRDMAILPGVGYLEMACAAFSQVRGDSPFILTKVMWLNPFIVKSDKQPARIVLKEEGGKLSYKVISHDGSKEVVHSKGIFESCEKPSGKQLLPVEDIKKRCQHHAVKEDIYKRFRGVGINYGDYFQGLVELYSGQDEALGVLELPSAFNDELGPYRLHPTIMDGALQSIGGILGSEKRTMIPFSVEALQVISPITGKAYSYIRKIGDNRFNVAVLDDKGFVCVKLHEVSLLELKDAFSKFFCIPNWVKSQRAPVMGGVEPETGRDVLIIYSDSSCGIEKGLSEFYSKGNKVSKIKLGLQQARISDTEWEIDACNPEALDKCIMELGRLDKIYFLGGIGIEETDTADVGLLESSQERGVLSLYRLIRALARQGKTKESIHINVVTNDVCRVVPADRVKPYGASLHGLAKSIANEYPKLKVSCVDISLRGEKKDIINSILNASFDSKAKIIPIRDGICYEQELLPATLAGVNGMPLKQQGVYLILGGAGGIGLELTRYLSERFKALIVLIGRGELSTEKKDKISKIESKGGRVLYIQADATNLASMKAAVEKAKGEFGSINGVIHSAIVLRDKMLDNMDEETFRMSLDPKVKGSVILAEAVKGESLDFMLFLSSAQSFYGNAQQSNYAAGCTFKDAFAAHLKDRGAYPVRVINWGYWGSVGVVASEAYRKYIASLGIYSIEPWEGIEAIERVLGNNFDQVIAIKADEKNLEQIGLKLDKKLDQKVNKIAVKRPSFLENIISDIAD